MPHELPRLAARLAELRSGIAALSQSCQHLQAQIIALEQQEAKLAAHAAKARRSDETG